MKHFSFFLLLYFSLFSFPLAKADLPNEPFSQSDNPELSVWQISFTEENIKERSINATGFFIGENHFITNFHVISAMLHEATPKTNIVLSQEGNDSVLGIKKVLALSAIYDLALLETEDPVTNFLRLGKDHPRPGENLFSIAYPHGNLTQVTKTENVTYEDEISYIFPVNRSKLSGASGGPILDKQGQVVGINSRASDNIIVAMRLDRLPELITGDMGTRCSSTLSGFIFSGVECIKEEIGSLQKLAEQGHDFAQYALSMIYHKGDILAKDLRKAFYWCKKAAEQGYILAQSRLALMYINGEGVGKSLDDALFWVRESANQGNVIDQVRLARIYQRIAVDVDDQEFESAFSWFQEAARRGHILAQYNLALMYKEGEGTEKDPGGAFYWLNRAAEQDHIFSKYQLALMYYYAEGIEQDFQKAFHYFREIAEQGYKSFDIAFSLEQGYESAQYNLAVMYKNGEGTEQNFDEALKWYTRAAEQWFAAAQDWLKQTAEQGHAKAQYEWALMHSRGKGVKENPNKAYKWFQKAAEQGHAPAQYELALIYYEGRKRAFFRFSKDLSKTYHWLIEASKQEYEPALSQLTDMVCEGEGTEEDINKAVAWLQEASEQGGLNQKCQDQLREKGIDIGAIGLVAAAMGAEQAYAQSSESTTEVAFHIKEPAIQAGESISGSSVDSEKVLSTSEIDAESASQTTFEASGESISQTAFEVDEESVSKAMLEADAGSATQAEGMSSGINEEMVTEVSDALGEVAADLALDWIPIVGFGKLGFEALAGVHLLTGRDLTTFERAASGGGAVLNLVGFGWLKNLKSLKHSKAVGQQANKWFSVYINSEQWAKFSHFVGEGQMGRARAYLTSVFQSIGEIGFKVKRRVTTRKKVLASGGSSVDEASETVVVNMEEGLGVPGRLESDKLSRAVDPDKLSNPGQSKVYKTGDVDQIPSARDGVFVRTPRGDQPLNYNNPEVLSWLRQAEVPQRQAVESLINRGANRTVGSSSATPPSLIKTGVKESDFDLVLH